DYQVAYMWSALVPTGRVEQTWRIGRYTVAIEQVVDPHLHHLNVAVALGESVAGEESGDPSRNDKCPIIQPKIIILDLRRPIGRESPLDARTHQPTAVGVVVGGGDRCAGRQIVDGEVVVADPTAAGLAIKEPGAIRHAEPRSQGRDPSIVGSHLDSSERRNKYGTSVIVGRSPVDVPFQSENEVADLPVEPELASSDEYAVVVSIAKVQAREGVAQVIVAPSSPNVAAKIKPSPSEHRSHIGRRRRRRIRSRRHISGIRGHRRCYPR